MTRIFAAVLYAAILILALNSATSGTELSHVDFKQVGIFSVNWGGATSRGDIRVSGLPRIQSARESARLAPRARLKARKKGSRSAPGERINRPEFGSGDKATGRLTGRRQHKPIKITKRVDNATPLIRMAHRTKRPLPRVVLRARDASGKYYNVVLADVRVTAYFVSGSGRSAMEQVTLVFEKIERQ